jgi:hypothetical protein
VLINSATAHISSATGFINDTDYTNALLRSSTAITAATVQINNATAAVSSATGFINTAAAFGVPAGEYMNVAQTDLGIASQHLNRSAQELQVALTDNRPSGIWLQVASQDLAAVSHRLSEATTNLNTVGSRLSVANAGRHYEQWGQTRIAMAKADLRKIVKRHIRRDQSVE